MVLAAKAVVFGLVCPRRDAKSSAFSAFSHRPGDPDPATTRMPPLSQPWRPPRAVIGGGLYLTVLGLFALGLAAIFRHTAGAISRLRRDPC